MIEVIESLHNIHYRTLMVLFRVAVSRQKY